MTREEFEAIASQAELPPEATAFGVMGMTAVMAPSNQPEYWADAPWRVEPDQTEIPFTFYIRDANSAGPDHGPWRLDSLQIEQRIDDRKWFKLRTFLPAELKDLDEQGYIRPDFWVFSTAIPGTALHNLSPGDTVHFRVVFQGSPYPYEKTEDITRHLEVYFPQFSLPEGRVASGTGQRRWFYGDTHYHSAYSNDIKEYGAPLLETRSAALAIGLDWLVVTDHSCDLGLVDLKEGNKSRWDRLMEETRSPSLSDDRFRFILGEEITLIGQGNRYVHMLAMGGLQKMIPGAFLPERSSNLINELMIKAVRNILRYGKGYPPYLVQSLFGEMLTFDEVVKILPPGTLTFAAHPCDFATIPPAKWAVENLSSLQLTGYEIWNGRSRRKAKKTDNPFTQKSWTQPETLKRSDDARISKIYRRVSDTWDPQLILGIEDSTSEDILPARRPVLIGGSDAHGDFNYHAGMAWDYSTVDLIDDNSLGRVRTAVYLPDHETDAIPEVDQILAALKKGSCVVTDGPLLEFSLQFQGQNKSMGEMLVITGDGEPVMNILARTTPEFGPVTQVDIVTYFKGQKSRKCSILTVEPGKPASLYISGEQGYCRLQAQTVGMNGERFCCFTNPIWIRVPGQQQKRLEIHFDV